MMEDKDLQTIEIDLNANKRGEVTEGWLKLFGTGIKWIMKSMFGSGMPPSVKVTGNKQQLSDFASVLGREKRYIQTAAKYGLNDPRAYKDKYALRGKIRKFEGSTGIKWPFK